LVAADAARLQNVLNEESRRSSIAAVPLTQGVLARLITESRRSIISVESHDLPLLARELGISPEFLEHRSGKAPTDISQGLSPTAARTGDLSKSRRLYRWIFKIATLLVVAFCFLIVGIKAASRDSPRSLRSRADQECGDAIEKLEYSQPRSLAAALAIINRLSTQDREACCRFQLQEPMCNRKIPNVVFAINGMRRHIGDEGFWAMAKALLSTTQNYADMFSGKIWPPPWPPGQQKNEKLDLAALKSARKEIAILGEWLLALPRPHRADGKGQTWNDRVIPDARRTNMTKAIEESPEALFRQLIVWDRIHRVAKEELGEDGLVGPIEGRVKSWCTAYASSSFIWLLPDYHGEEATGLRFCKVRDEGTGQPNTCETTQRGPPLKGFCLQWPGEYVQKRGEGVCAQRCETCSEYKNSYDIDFGSEEGAE
jgi:hypothetical protein